MTKRLNIGSGDDYKQEWVNLDCRSNIKIDVKHNLEKIPYPFKANTFDEILMKSVLEHLSDPVAVLKEVIRISKNNAKLTILVPHATFYANFSDLQHKHNFTETTFSLEHLKEYELEKLTLLNLQFIYKSNKWKKFIPFKRFLKIFFNGIYNELLFEFKIKK